MNVVRSPSLAAADYLSAKAVRVRAQRSASAARGAELDALRERAASAPRRLSLVAALRAGPLVAVIAEFKRRSPSAGELAGAAAPLEVATTYAAAGARGVSILTDGDDFGGELADLSAVAGRVPLPALRKDFIVDEAALCEARLAGAAAALLIVRMLSQRELELLLAAAATIGLECLVEVHDVDELDRALAAGASLVGVNNRDLGTLRTDLSVTERLAGQVPQAITLVSESGIRSAADVGRAAAAGAHGVLVGEALLRVKEPERSALLAELAGVGR